MLKKYLDKLQPYLDKLNPYWEKLRPQAQVAIAKGKHFYKHAEVIAQQKWAQPRFRLISSLLGALVLGVVIGMIFAPSKNDTENTHKTISVDKTGIINLSLPGVTLSPDVFEFYQTGESTAPIMLSVPGRLAYNAERVKVISARAPGRVERIYAFDGAVVKEGDAVADFYSPDYVSAQTEYILSSKMVAALNKADVGTLYQDAKDTQEAAANHLRILGGSNQDIQRLRTTGLASPTFPIRAPIQGVVIKRAVDPGAYLNTGDVLATIADPKNLWFVGNVYEQDISKIHVGDIFHLKVEAFPERDFVAKANYVGASIDPTTHALVIRCEIENADGLLKPEMFATGTLEVGTTSAVVIPTSALIQARNARFVIIKTGPESYSRLPVYGFELNDHEFAVTDGLTAHQTLLIKGATLLNQRFAREED
ncbi:efflux RND transporter periplasmic adaptor subunit [Polynucleobacter paneuropaeus]|uniref:Efflux RND transporter periplasmic adaptor subunit n=1 Tax=Polynucleobacter paneuropaeus TaxID=2527775 RepID=A0ABX9FAR3_9BURK|nr:efflux RND transporter periplasmic adaptor subunit [Polynucleobacter paneuropaeus]QWD18705.1 efflux RND transporter periplasmic adaptor subunit [Polynucleobacter paneuropaeus]QWD36049.1 efflux RND transporter periplasmic adaptor subunit [Polynucleobacter paneuropaeus]RAZ42115.1 efflux RND transporter periplasmic adaptor subunit [Polynucleobacter paneuropaeus]